MTQTPTSIETHAHQNQGYAATIGFFDGVHRGHCSLLGELRQQAACRGLESMVITFDRHPRQVVQPQWQPQLLTTTAEKQALLAAEGIDRVVVLPFDRTMAQLSARSFMQRVLAGELGVSMLLTGYDNRFGHGREEGFNDYVAYGRELGIDVVQAQPFAADGQRFSSSMIRHLLAEGDVAGAARALGRCYTLGGTVVHGQQIGRRLGFPTANLYPDEPLQLIPLPGVYAVRVSVEGGTTYDGMMNIGHRPTFDGQDLTLEAHLFGFSGNLYDRRVSVAFVARLRDEMPFSTPAQLAHQMQADALQAHTLLATPCGNAT